MTSIIQNQTIQLSNQFEIIKQIITTQDIFSNLSSICSFNEKKESITFKTEKIHPHHPPKSKTSVILLFSNPHPISVQSGLFLSEPHSRSFWQRTFACNCIQPPAELMDSITNWSSHTIEILSTNLINPTYSAHITLFFDCLESLPSNQYGDLKKIFKNKAGKELRKNTLQVPGMEQLYEVSKKNNITSWVVFSAEAYRYICREKDIAKYAPDRICSTIDKYLSGQDNDIFWKELKDLRSTISINDLEITVYLSLIARRKNWKTKNGKYYFTIMLDQIFQNIIN